jgi:hypothetical protein
VWSKRNGAKLKLYFGKRDRRDATWKSIKLEYLIPAHTQRRTATYDKMSLDDWLDGERHTVDPEVRAYVGSLVNAVRITVFQY